VVGLGTRTVAEDTNRVETGFNSKVVAEDTCRYGPRTKAKRVAEDTNRAETGFNSKMVAEDTSRSGPSTKAKREDTNSVEDTRPKVNIPPLRRASPAEDSNGANRRSRE